MSKLGVNLIMKLIGKEREETPLLENTVTILIDKEKANEICSEYLLSVSSEEWDSEDAKKYIMDRYKEFMKIE